MNPSGPTARLLDQVLVALDQARSPHRYAILRIAKYALERRIPVFYAPVVALQPARVIRHAA